MSLCTTTVPSRGTVVIRHQSTRRALCAHLVCFASSCATAQIPSSDNTDDTQYLHAYFSFVSIDSFDPNSSWNLLKKEAEFLLVQYIYIYKNRKLFSPALLWKTYIRGAKRGGEKGKTFHPSFIHVLVITSISISRRISNSRSRMYIGYKDASVSVQRAAPVANIKQGRGGPVCAGAPRENRGVYIHAYVCMYMHPRYTKHIGRLSGAGKQPQSKQFARLIDFPWHPRFGVHATRCVHPPPPRWRRQACDRASTDLPIG